MAHLRHKAAQRHQRFTDRVCPAVASAADEPFDLAQPSVNASASSSACDSDQQKAAWALTPLGYPSLAETALREKVTRTQCSQPEN